MAHCVRVASIMVGKAWQRAEEAAGHVAATVVRQRGVNAGSETAFR